jgi:ElaB/YqjD/DUF883 family membrane-anchored ribosome-binding protein
LAIENKNKQSTNVMSTQTQELNEAGNQLADDAGALINATAGVAGEKVGEARKRLAAALERAKEVAGRVRERAVAGAKAADECVHEHPYQAIAIGVGLGLVVGYILGRRGRND